MPGTDRIDWGAIKREYVTTRISQMALGRKYGVSWREINRKSVAEKWVEAREKHHAKEAQARLITAEQAALDYKGTIYETAFKVAAQLRDLVAEGDLFKKGIRPRDVTGALKDIADILAIRSEADAEEQRARIDKLKADAERAKESEGEKQIVVTIDGGAKGWSE